MNPFSIIFEQNIYEHFERNDRYQMNDYLLIDHKTDLDSGDIIFDGNKISAGTSQIHQIML